MISSSRNCQHFVRTLQFHSLEPTDSPHSRNMSLKSVAFFGPERVESSFKKQHATLINLAGLRTVHGVVLIQI